MSYIIALVRYIQTTIQINKYCRELNISKTEAKELLSKNDKRQLGSKKSKLKKLIKLLKKRRIMVIAMAVITVIAIICIIAVYSMMINSKEQMAAVASCNVAMSNQKVEGEYTIFTGEAICDLDGNGGLAISADILNKYKVKCNGNYALKIKYRSYEIYNIAEDDDKKTVIDYENSDRTTELQVGTESVEETEAVASTENNDESLAAYRVLGSKEFPLQRDNTEYELVFHTGDEDILSNGTYLSGYNWIISQVDVVDIERRREWQLKNGQLDADNTDGTGENSGGQTADGTLNPQSRRLKNWYNMFRDLQAACNVVNNEACKPYTLIGTFLREINATMTSDLNSDTWDYSKDLNSDTNNNTNKASGVLTFDAQNGWGQFNKGLWEAQRRKYGENNPGAALTEDTALGIYRPNCWYSSDQVWTTEIYNTQFILNRDEWSQITSNSGYATLSEEDKAFILGYMVEVLHNRGGNKLRVEIDRANTLIAIAQNESQYGMNSLFDMADKAGVASWDQVNCYYIGNGIGERSAAPAKEKYDAVFSLGWISDTTNREFRFQEYAYITALCAGYKCYNQLMQQIVADSPTDNNGGTGGNGTIDGEGGSTESSNRVVSMAQNVWNTWQAEGCNYYSQSNWYRTSSYGNIRPDCSGYVSCVIWQLGYTTNYNAITSGSYARNSIGWTVVGRGQSVELQPGDILAYDGHVQIFAGYDSSNRRLWFSWGNNNAARNPAPTTSADCHFTGRTDFVILRAP